MRHRRQRSHRPATYYEVAGVDLAEEMDRLRGLAVFADGQLPSRRPELKVRRASSRPGRLGFAVPEEWRLSVTDYPGIRVGDALETLLHELVHLHVGTEPEHRRWHGRRFKAVLRRGMAEGYGITGVRPRGTLHGAYADALERRRQKRRRRRSSPIPGQLSLPLTDDTAAAIAGEG
jgi:hypothetical protein